MLNFFKKTGLTKRELIVIGFLLCTFVLGLIIKYSGWKTPADFDYRDRDKQFDENIKSAFSNLEKTKDSLTDEQRYRADELRRFSDSLLTNKENQPKTKSEVKLDKKININLAYATDLQLLPGIGEVIAERIVEYREQKGNFKKTEDIKKVKGIGDKKFDEIKEYITVE